MNKYIPLCFLLLNVIWLWGCLVYMFIAIMRNYFGWSINPYLNGVRLHWAMVLVAFWIWYMLDQMYIGYDVIQHDYLSLNRIIEWSFMEGINLCSSICCTLLILGVGIKNKNNGQSDCQ